MSHRAFLVVLLLLAAPACERRAAHRPAPAATPAPAAPPAPAPAPAPAAHDPARPAIDCPLHKKGVDPSRMRPFEDVEKYIAFLERPDRALWQKPDRVVAALGLTGSETVVDLGAGSGYFAFRMARALPHGKVVAVDIEPEMVRYMHHRVLSEGIANVEVVLGEPTDPGIPAGADLVFVCDVLHHVQDRAAWLGKLVSEMRTGARLVLIEFKEGDLPEGPPESVKLPRAQLIASVTRAGLVLADEQAGLLPYQTFLVFRKPPAARGGSLDGGAVEPPGPAVPPRP